MNNVRFADKKKRKNTPNLLLIKALDAAVEMQLWKSLEQNVQ